MSYERQRSGRALFGGATYRSLAQAYQMQNKNENENKNNVVQVKYDTLIYSQLFALFIRGQHSVRAKLQSSAKGAAHRTPKNFSLSSLETGKKK